MSSSGQNSGSRNANASEPIPCEICHRYLYRMDDIVGHYDAHRMEENSTLLHTRLRERNPPINPRLPIPAFINPPPTFQNPIQNNNLPVQHPGPRGIAAPGGIGLQFVYPRGLPPLAPPIRRNNAVAQRLVQPTIPILRREIEYPPNGRAGPSFGQLHQPVADEIDLVHGDDDNSSSDDDNSSSDDSD